MKIRGMKLEKEKSNKTDCLIFVEKFKKLLRIKLRKGYFGFILFKNLQVCLFGVRERAS